jgi:chromosome segregation ATPase
VDDVREAELSLKDRDRELKAVTARQETLIDTAEAPVDPGATEDLKAELEARLEQKTEEYERLARSLEDEQRRIAELERERALQNQSLRVLHQQLELAEERNQRAAAG